MEKKIEEEKKVKNELTYEQLREFYDTSCTCNGLYFYKDHFVF